MPDFHHLGDWLVSSAGYWLLRFLDWLGGVGLAGALWLTGRYDAGIAAWVDPKYAGLLLSPKYHSAPLLLLFVLACIWLRLALRPGRRASANGRPEERPLRIRRQPWYRRFSLWRNTLWRQPFYWKIGRQVANLNQTHGLVVGGSGSGKSTLVVQLILQPTINLMMWAMRRAGHWKRRAVLIISFDRSDPIEEATNVLEDSGVPVERWRVRQSNGWDMLQGDIEMIAEALPDGWSKADGDTGFFRQLCSDSISVALHEQDDAGLPRDFNDMIERMDRIMEADPEIPTLAHRTWVRRFKSLARVMGESIGNDFDLVKALKAGKVVHLSSNSYTNPAITPLVGAMAITHAKLAAEQVGDVYLVLEEAGFLKNRSSVLDDLSRSMRARGWRVVYLSQNPGDVGDVLQVNFGVAVFMGLGPLASKARQWCADVVKGFPGAFRAEEIVLGATIDQLEGYVLMNGRCRDVSLAPYITRAAEHRPAKPSGNGPSTNGHAWRTSGQNGGSGFGQAASRRPGPGQNHNPGGSSLVVEIVRDVSRDEAPGQKANRGLERGKPLMLPSGKKVVPTCVGKKEERFRIWDKLKGTWDTNACHLWLEKSRNREYGKTWYAQRGGWSTHFLAWAWRVMEDHELGRSGDLEVFYSRHPEIPMFVWPVDGSAELVVLLALKEWMARPLGTKDLSETEKKMNLQVDHRCPGASNTLCANWSHLWIVTYLENTQLRNQRKNGTWHDLVDGVMTVQ